MKRHLDMTISERPIIHSKTPFLWNTRFDNRNLEIPYFVALRMARPYLYWHEICAFDIHPCIVTLLFKKSLSFVTFFKAQPYGSDWLFLPSKQTFPPSRTFCNAKDRVLHGSFRDPHSGESWPLCRETKSPWQSLRWSCVPATTKNPRVDFKIQSFQLMCFGMLGSYFFCP